MPVGCGLRALPDGGRAGGVRASLPDSGRAGGLRDEGVGHVVHCLAVGRASGIVLVGADGAVSVAAALNLCSQLS